MSKKARVTSTMFAATTLAAAANSIYAERLVNTGNVDGVDVISGATILHGEFQGVVKNALDKAAQ